jgi:ribose transport system substrate-binding protein
MKPLRLAAVAALVVSLFSLAACTRKSGSAGNRYGKWILHSTKYDDVDQKKALTNAEDVLTQLADQDKVCLIGLWAYNPPAILEAVKKAGRTGKVKIIGFDEHESTLKGIRDGHIHATIVQNPYAFGYETVKWLAKAAKDPNTPLPPEVKNGIWHVPHRVIRKDNVDAFEKDLEEKKKSAQTTPMTPAGLPRVAFVTNNPAEFWLIAEAGARKAAAEFGVELLFRRPDKGDAASQKEKIEAALNDGAKAIAVSVVDPENQKTYLDQIAGRAVLVTVDNDAPNSRRKFYIGTDNIAAGKEVGKLVKEVLPDGGTIAIFVGQPDPINARQRRQGVLDELAGKDNAQGE